MVDYTLETDKMSARYDLEQHILFVAYRGVMTPDVTAVMYRWLMAMIEEGTHDIHETRGAVYDFRDVTEFSASNIGTSQRQSQQANTKTDMSHIPVALVTKNLMQTEWVRLTMKITPGQDRKRIVKSMDEAMAYFEEFHARKALEKAVVAAPGENGTSEPAAASEPPVSETPAAVESAPAEGKREVAEGSTEAAQ
jgi:hypothetical protein